MCRFLLVKSEQKVEPQKFLKQFAEISQKSKALNGDWQGDGWGFSYLDDKKRWQTYKSVKPVWEEDYIFKEFPEVNIFLTHARSASYMKNLNDVNVNQPYFNDNYCYVFNGDLEGVCLNKRVPGAIGAQKIWNLLQERLTKMNPEKSLKDLSDFLYQHTKTLHALNIGLADTKNIYALCRFTPNSIAPDYHVLCYLNKPHLKIICSDLLGGFKMENFKEGEILKF